ncbi:hypothetical protein TanjilG_08274 [Lupinus angustifolius]|uniref:Uncharacterized protein n=1 Tax=Lupinus angustifolius TaxID=3871 RepID=A0A394DAY6_LUPAN|nr:hypothetical protein TanjilG_08274 [Lupinus angustifolius]
MFLLSLVGRNCWVIGSDGLTLPIPSRTILSSEFDQCVMEQWVVDECSVLWTWRRYSPTGLVCRMMDSVWEVRLCRLLTHGMGASVDGSHLLVSNNTDFAMGSDQPFKRFFGGRDQVYRNE